jgi:hypothetical protein
MHRFLFMIVLLATIARPARGDTDAVQEAEKRYQEGVRLFAQKRFGEARTRFLEACAADRTQNCVKNLAMTEEELGLWDQAATHWREFVDDPRAQTDPDNARHMDDFRARGARARVRCVELDIVAPPGTLISIDDQEVGRAPLPRSIFVTPGAHRIMGRAGDQRDEKRVTESAGVTDRIQLAITATSDGPPPPTREETRMMPPPTASLVLAGVGLVGIGLGAGFGIASSSAKSDLDSGARGANGVCGASSLDPVCVKANDQRNTANTMGTAAVVGYVAGGAALAGAVVWWLLAPRKVRVQGALVAPWADHAGAGLTFRGRF